MKNGAAANGLCMQITELSLILDLLWKITPLDSDDDDITALAGALTARGEATQSGLNKGEGITFTCH